MQNTTNATDFLYVLQLILKMQLISFIEIKKISYKNVLMKKHLWMVMSRTIKENMHLIK